MTQPAPFEPVLPGTPPPEGMRVWRCSFCGKAQDQVDKLIAGQGVYICNECVQLCQEIIDAGRAEAG